MLPEIPVQPLPYVPQNQNQLAILRQQADRYDLALKSLYLDKTSGLLTPDEFVQLMETFRQEQVKLREKFRQLSSSDRLPSSPSAEADDTQPTIPATYFTC